MLKISYASCPGLSPAILAQLTLKCSPQPKIAKNTKTVYFGGLGSCKVINVYTTKKLVTNACYNKQYVCAYLQMFSG